MKTFTYTSTPSRVVFGSGTVAEVGNEVHRLHRSRVLLLGGPRLTTVTTAISEALGPLIVARFDDATMHTPTEVTTRALALAEKHAVDCVVAVGGGSTTGLSKALAARAGYDQIIVPTTYAGSEVTPVLGETTDGVKTTRSGPEILPETVIYDVDLTVGLPTELTLTSAINAMAHAVEALYSPETNPVIDSMAQGAIAAITRALPIVMADPTNLDARADLLQSAWLAGQCLGADGMGLHHKLCHTLGGSFSLPHAPTHTVILPHAMAYNAAAAPEVMAKIADAMRVPDAAAGVYDLIAALGGPTSLAELGFTRENIDSATELAIAKPYPNPRPVTGEGITDLLTAAYEGRRPGGGAAVPAAGQPSRAPSSTTPPPR
ncbi:maleylacetate reductase [Rhodococcus sp. IEGM 1379]|uniref:maleylacetate reductase n=1 Tax=Rhodococcus sp. IEGM 1379 TaxID=3047086 RepID=UPI0024B797C1|nr:maleylacetate reductase [Rhodococcus sp. IEGM 1379]MDI9917737.1 maleylacetate reductase [Rhodococcus sp. IEGM 1379]